MAEPAKKTEPKTDPDMPRVSELQLVQQLNLQPIGGQSRLTLQRDPNRPGIGPVPVLDMIWDKAAEVVLVKWSHLKDTGTYIVPLSNVSGMKLAD